MLDEESHFKRQPEFQTDASQVLEPSELRGTYCISIDDTPSNAMKSISHSPAAKETTHGRLMPSTISLEAGNSKDFVLSFHLENGHSNQQPYGWHRNNERAARGLSFVDVSSTILEDWEGELVWTETLLLHSRQNPSSYVHLAYAWGQQPGFHEDIAKIVTERRRKQAFQYPRISTLSAESSTTGETSATRKSEGSSTAGLDPTAESLAASYHAFLADSFDAESWNLSNHSSQNWRS